MDEIGKITGRAQRTRNSYVAHSNANRKVSWRGELFHNINSFIKQSWWKSLHSTAIYKADASTVCRSKCAWCSTASPPKDQSLKLMSAEQLMMDLKDGRKVWTRQIWQKFWDRIIASKLVGPGRVPLGQDAKFLSQLNRPILHHEKSKPLGLRRNQTS